MNIIRRPLACLVLTSALLSGCGSQPDITAVQCVFPDAPDVPAPSWVCDEPVPELEVTAVGSHPKSQAGHDFMKQQAAASARIQLASNLKVHIQGLVKRYSDTTGSGDRETLDQIHASISKVVIDQVLMGTRIYKTRVSPTGQLYVLVGMDTENAAFNTQQVLRSSMNSERALWQRFQANKGFDELARDITSQSNN